MVDNAFVTKLNDLDYRYKQLRTTFDTLRVYMTDGGTKVTDWVLFDSVSKIVAVDLIEVDTQIKKMTMEIVNAKAK